MGGGGLPDAFHTTSALRRWLEVGSACGTRLIAVSSSPQSSVWDGRLTSEACSGHGWRRRHRFRTALA